MQGSTEMVVAEATPWAGPGWGIACRLGRGKAGALPRLCLLAAAMCGRPRAASAKQRRQQLRRTCCCGPPQPCLPSSTFLVILFTWCTMPSMMPATAGAWARTGEKLAQSRVGARC